MTTLVMMAAGFVIGFLGMWGYMSWKDSKRHDWMKK